MNLEFEISRRLSLKGGSTQGIMTRVACAAVCISTAVMVITVCVISGFRNSVDGLLRGYTSNIVVTDIRSLRSGEAVPVRDSEQLRSIISLCGCQQIDRYAVRSGVLRSSEGAVGVILRGVEAGSAVLSSVQQKAEGDMLEFDDLRKKQVLISSKTASRLRVGCSDKIELLYADSCGMFHRDKFKVLGIYDSPLDPDQGSVVLTDLRNVQKINGWAQDQISGYMLMLPHGERALDKADELQMELLYSYEGEENVTAVSSQEMFAGIYSWLSTHDVNANVIITIMTLVSLFNIVTALLIMVLERTRMIGIFSSLGMSVAKQRMIFFYKALSITFRGLVYGNCTAFAMIFLQRHFGLLKLDSSAYFVDSVPVDIPIVNIFAVNLFFIVAIMVILLVSTAIVSRINPAQSIRYE